MQLTDETINEYEMARWLLDKAWEKSRYDFYAPEYQAALARYDAAVAKWNKECRE